MMTNLSEIETLKHDMTRVIEAQQAVETVWQRVDVRTFFNDEFLGLLSEMDYEFVYGGINNKGFFALFADIFKKEKERLRDKQDMLFDIDKIADRLKEQTALCLTK